MTFKVVLPQDRVFFDTTINVENPLLVNPADQRIHLYGAGGETVYFQLVVPAGQAEPQTLQVGPLKLVQADGPIPASMPRTIEADQWRTYQLLGIPVKTYDAVYARLEGPAGSTPRSFPDPMVELPADGSGRFSLPKSAEGNTILLLQMTLPSKAIGAEFAGPIALSSGSQSLSRPLVLRTWGFDLPDPGVGVFGLVNVAKVWSQHNLGTLRDENRLILPPDPARAKTLGELVGQYARLLDGNGIEPWISHVYPRLSGADPENLAIDWTAYRTMAESVLRNATRGRKFWPVPVDLAYPSTTTYGPYDSPIYRRMLGRFLGTFQDHILKSGLAGKPVAALAWADTHRQALDMYNSYVAMAQTISSAGPAVATIDPFIPIDLRPLGWSDFRPFDRLTKLTRILCPCETWLDPSATEAARRQGTLVWWRPSPAGGSLPAENLTYPGYYSQALAWAAWRYASQGIVLEEANDWTNYSPGAAGKDAGLSAAGDPLIYPGSWFGQDHPLGSRRLAFIKAGLQDVAYLRALERAGKKNLADWLARHLVRYAHTEAYDGSLWSIRNDGLCGSSQAWALARLIAGLEINESRPVPATQRAEADRLQIQRKVLLSQFRDATEGVALETDGVRARNVLDTKTGNERIEWTFHTVVRNFTDTAAAGTLEFINPSAPLSAIRDRQKVGGLAWAWPVRTELKLESPAAALGVFGVNYQPITLKLKDNNEVVLNARYCALAAQRIERSVEIDGRLDDWPESPTAVAGNFLRIAPDGLNDRRPVPADRAAASGTTVQIGYTDQNLYLAFTCRQPRETLVTRPSNTVLAAAGMPWGEDLVEVLIEPNNTGSFNPLDVYHLIVKANGTCLGLRGTVDAADIGPAGMWATTARAAVKVFTDHWQAEIAIPLAELGGPDKLGRWWGMDFARFAAATSEMSTWSGTKNQYCKPISLGNVFFAK